MSSSNPDLAGTHSAADEEVKNIMSSKVGKMANPGRGHRLFYFLTKTWRNNTKATSAAAHCADQTLSCSALE